LIYIYIYIYIYKREREKERVRERERDLGDESVDIDHLLLPWRAREREEGR
jgi:hypothetical protein